MLTKEDLEAIGEVVNKRFETFELKIEGKINAAKEELRNEIEISRADAKSDSLRILGKLDKQNTRIENLEKATGTPNPHKN